MKAETEEEVPVYPVSSRRDAVVGSGKTFIDEQGEAGFRKLGPQL